MLVVGSAVGAVAVGELETARRVAAERCAVVADRAAGVVGGGERGAVTEVGLAELDLDEHDVAGAVGGATAQDHVDLGGVR